MKLPETVLVCLSICLKHFDHFIFRYYYIYFWNSDFSGLLWVFVTSQQGRRVAGWVEAMTEAVEPPGGPGPHWCRHNGCHWWLPALYTSPLLTSTQHVTCDVTTWPTSTARLRTWGRSHLCKTCRKPLSWSSCFCLQLAFHSTLTFRAAEWNCHFVHLMNFAINSRSDGSTKVGTEGRTNRHSARQTRRPRTSELYKPHGKWNSKNYRQLTRASSGRKWREKTWESWWVSRWSCCPSCQSNEIRFLSPVSPSPAVSISALHWLLHTILPRLILACFSLLTLFPTLFILVLSWPHSCFLPYLL